MLQAKKGQSTMEYIIVFSAIVIAILVLAYGKLKTGVDGVLGAAQSKMTNAAAKF